MINTQFKIIEGDKPILFTVPHSRIHRRPTLTESYKQPEPYTDSIVEIMCMNTNCWGMILTSMIDYDPNYQKEENNEFKKTLRTVTNKNKMKGIIDVHGVLNTAPYDIGIFYTDNYYKSEHLAEMLRNELKKDKLADANIAILKFLDNDQETIGKFSASQLQIPSVQIEIAKYIRDDDKLRNTLVQNLSNIIDTQFV